jgi:hypothetical protein
LAGGLKEGTAELSTTALSSQNAPGHIENDVSAKFEKDVNPKKEGSRHSESGIALWRRTLPVERLSHLGYLLEQIGPFLALPALARRDMHSFGKLLSPRA